MSRIILKASRVNRFFAHSEGPLAMHGTILQNALEDTLKTGEDPKARAWPHDPARCPVPSAYVRKESEEIFDQNKVRLVGKLFALRNKTSHFPLGLDQFKSITAAILPEQALHLAGQAVPVQPDNDPELRFRFLVQDEQNIHSFPPLWISPEPRPLRDDRGSEMPDLFDHHSGMIDQHNGLPEDLQGVA